MSDLLQRLLQDRAWLLADGATGTNLFAMGLESGDSPELWNIDADKARKIHDLNKSFVDAGSDIILTNSFGGNRHRLKLHQAQDRAHEVNKAAAEIARRAVDDAGREVVVAGSMGPTGEIFEPLGPLSLDQGIVAFAEQARALEAGGADVLWIETLSSVEELSAAAKGAATTALPFVCTLSFDTNGRTMMGVSPAEIAGLVKELTPPPLGYGANCGVGAAELVVIIQSMKEAAAPEDVLIAKSNAGIPEFVDGEIQYTGTPDLMANYARLVYASGARIIGGCCGNTPDHIKAMRQALADYQPDEPPALEAITEALGEVSRGARGEGPPLGEGPTAERRGRRGRERRRARF